MKLAVCGSGAAAKDQVQRMVGALLALAEPPESDHAADALALAICHAFKPESRAAARSPQTTQEASGLRREYEP